MLEEESDRQTVIESTERVEGAEKRRKERIGNGKRLQR